MAASDQLLDMLYAGASEEAFARLLLEAAGRGVSAQELEELRTRCQTALRIRERMLRQRQREAELTALYETANDLIAIRDVDTILAAIVRRARNLLQADITYLSLNDEREGASYMKVTDGSVSAEFRDLRLPLGTGLLGLVAQRGAPYYTDDYQHDQRFVHRDYIDHAVADERIRAILGVPLMVEGKVIGALLAGHRTVRAFPPNEVSLLTSFAAHAAVALENARLFSEARAALIDLDAANRQISQQAEAVELAAEAHDRLTDVLLGGGGVDEVIAVLGDVLHGSLSVYDADAHLVAATDAAGPAPEELQDPFAASRATGRCVETTHRGASVWVAAAIAGAEHLGTLVLHRRREPLSVSERRTIERGAVVTALVLLFARSVADAEDRLRGDLLADLLADRERDTGSLRVRARRHRTDLDSLGLVVVAEVASDWRSSAARQAAILARELGGLGGEYQSQIVVVAPGREALRAGECLLERLIAKGGRPGGRVAVGVATDPSRRLGRDAVVSAYRDARVCLATMRALGRTGVSDAAGLGVARLLLGHNGPKELEEFLQTNLGPLLEYDARRGTDLVGTLQAWLSTGGSPAEAARLLHVHPNTVAQRLDRIGRLLGPDWRSPDRVLERHLALTVWRMRGATER